MITDKDRTPHAPNVLELFDDQHFPAEKQELIDRANDNEAGEEALELLRALPERRYDSIRDLNAGLGQVKTLPHADNGTYTYFEEENSRD